MLKVPGRSRYVGEVDLFLALSVFMAEVIALAATAHENIHVPVFEAVEIRPKDHFGAH